jgi:pimeloyl-ACP methyl ester carboxylesterase
MNLSKRRKTFIAILAFLGIALVGAYFLSDAEKKTLDAETRASLPGQFVRLPEGVVHYELSGPEDAPLIVLVHGFSVPYYVWDPTFEALTEAGFRVLRYDLYGRGYSDRPDVTYDQELFTGQLGNLLSALELEEPVVLVGLSFGGTVVARYADEHREQVMGLVLIDPQVESVETGEVFPMNVPLLGEYIMSVYMAPHMLPNSQPDDFYRPERFPDWQAKYRDQMEYTGFKRALLASIRGMVGITPLADYQALGTSDLPTLLIWGEEDQTISAAQIDQVREAIPGAEFHPIAEAGHLSHYEGAEAVNPLLIGFLKRLEVAR